MSYQALARKWRPQIFAQLMGQEHVVAALTNALSNDRLHHAYLFTGTRGVGKTTIARIFAKSLNCADGVSAEPCGQCKNCVAIDEGRFVDLVEVDAASRTKVEDTREILDNVQYRPTQGRYKVYLIDEVHMLSRHSFNALLKTLEEPPPHIKFLLATTDPQKLPVTILSRCLQFSLKAMSLEQIQTQLDKILNAEKISFEAKALVQLAKSANGSMRDALSLTDQAIAQGNGQLSAETVRNMLGLLEEQHISKLLKAVLNNNLEQVMEAIAELSHAAVDPEQVLIELMNCFHQIALVQNLPSFALMNESIAEILTQAAETLPAEQIQLYYQVCLKGRRDLAFAAHPRVGLEMTLMRMLAFAPVSTERVEVFKAKKSELLIENTDEVNPTEQTSKPDTIQADRIAEQTASESIELASTEEVEKTAKAETQKGEENHTDTAAETAVEATQQTEAQPEQAMESRSEPELKSEIEPEPQLESETAVDELAPAPETSETQPISAAELEAQQAQILDLAESQHQNKLVENESQQKAPLEGQEVAQDQALVTAPNPAESSDISEAESAKQTISQDVEEIAEIAQTDDVAVAQDTLVETETSQPNQQGAQAEPIASVEYDEYADYAYQVESDDDEMADSTDLFGDTQAAVAKLPTEAESSEQVEVTMSMLDVMQGLRNKRQQKSAEIDKAQSGTTEFAAPVIAKETTTEANNEANTDATTAVNTAAHTEQTETSATAQLTPQAEITPAHGLDDLPAQPISGFGETGQADELEDDAPPWVDHFSGNLFGDEQAIPAEPIENSANPAVAEVEPQTLSSTPMQTATESLATQTVEPVENFSPDNLNQPLAETPISGNELAEQVRQGVRKSFEIDEWARLVESLGLMGLQRQFALHSSCTNLANKINLKLDEGQKHLDTEHNRQILKSKIKEVLQLDVELEVTIEGKIQDTPFQIQRSIDASRQDYAEELIQQDEKVQTLLEAFSGSIVEGSIKPL